MKERVLITGGAAGIGAAIVESYRSRGWSTVAIDRSDQADIRADLSSRQATDAALREALSGGTITRLVNNVATVCPNPLERQTLDEFDLTVSLNLRCAQQCVQALVPNMKQAGFGRIVNISSRAALGKELRSAQGLSVNG